MTTLQVIWFLLVGVLLCGYAVLDGFDLGVGFWHLFSKKQADRQLFLDAIGPVWDGNEVWLLTGGGALFAAFPPVYATVFSGFYLALVLLLLGLILRAVAIEFRGQVNHPTWRQRWDLAFAVGSVLPALLLGVALGNVVRGLPLNDIGDFTGGFFDLLNPFALLTGLAGLAMFATHGALFLAIKTDGELSDQAKRWAGRAWPIYLGLFLLTTAWSLVAYTRGSPLLPAAAAVVALVAIIAVRRFLSDHPGRAFWASAAAIVAIFGGVGATLFPNLVPASNDLSLSLTVANSSSSELTLMVMLIMAAIGMPLVIGYTVYIYRTFSGKVVPHTGGGYTE